MHSERPDAHSPHSTPLRAHSLPAAAYSESLQTLSRTKQAAGGGAAFPTPTDAIAKSEVTGKCGDVASHLGSQSCTYPEARMAR